MKHAAESHYGKCRIIRDYGEGKELAAGAGRRETRKSQQINDCHFHSQVTV